MKRRALGIVLVMAATVVGTWSQVPADPYHKTPPAKSEKLAPILGKSQLWFANSPVQRRAYEAAAAHDKVLYQLPCKCHCGRMGHTSLRTCFETTHGAGCDVCMKEAMYAALMTSKGKTPAQIRDGIERSDFNRIDLETGQLAQ